MSRAEFASRDIGKERPGRAVVRTAHVHLIPWGFATTELCGNALYPSAQQLSSMHQKGHCFHICGEGVVGLAVVKLDAMPSMMSLSSHLDA